MQPLKTTCTTKHTPRQAPRKRAKIRPTRGVIFSSMPCSPAAVHTKALPSAGHSTQAPMYVLQAMLQLNTSVEKEHPNVPPVLSRQPPASRPHPKHGAPPPSHTAEAKQQTVVSRWKYSTYASRTGTGTGCRRRRRRAGARGENISVVTRARTGALLDAHAREHAM
jgi:hypothetical protein